MIITTKQRATLKGIAMKLPATFQIGKSNLTTEIIEAVGESLEKRELVKISVLNNSSEDPKMMAIELANRTNSILVQIIGRKIVLYKKNKDNPVIKL